MGGSTCTFRGETDDVNPRGEAALAGQRALTGDERATGFCGAGEIAPARGERGGSATDTGGGGDKGDTGESTARGEFARGAGSERPRCAATRVGELLRPTPTKSPGRAGSLSAISN